MQGDGDISCSLISAAREGELERATELINSFGLSYSRDWSDGYVVLCAAVKNNHTEVAKLLLANGSKVNSIKKNPSVTALHFAVRNSAIEIVEMLLDRGANIDAECERGTTPLYDAVRWEKMEIVELLLNRGADVNAKGKYGKTYLHVAANEGYITIVEQLLKYGADANSVCTYDGNECCTPLYIAVMYRHEKVVQLLLECGANVDAQDQDGKTILYFAVEKGYSLIIEHLLKHSPDVNNSSNRNALNVAVHGYGNEYRKIAENLLQYGFTVNLVYGNNCELLHEAVKKECLKIVEELIKFGVAVDSEDKYGNTALHIASAKCKQEVVETLLKFGANIDIKDQYGNTALHIASAKCKREVVETLLKFGANIDIKDKYGNTALHIASDNDDPEIIKTLIKFGASIDTRHKYGHTALHIAVDNCLLEIIDVLLKFGADIHSTDGDGRTALHLASEYNHAEIVGVLLKFGADVDSKDKHGRTALHIACTHLVKRVAIALLDHGSDITITSEWNNPESFTEIFKRHRVKVKTANLYVMDENLLISSDDEELSDFRNECEKEVASMKSEKVGNISFYDILTKGISQLSIYAGNESIVQIFGSGDYKIKFPIYATLINSNFRKGGRRKDLMKQGNTIFHFFFTNFLGIPYDCTEKIFNYLSDEDLRSIIDACKPISVSSPNTDNK